MVNIHKMQICQNAISKLFELFYILDVTSEDCRQALLLDIKDYEDAVVSYCAVRNRMDYIVTRNIKDYKESKIKAVLPDEFIKLVSGEENLGI